MSGGSSFDELKQAAGIDALSKGDDTGAADINGGESGGGSASASPGGGGDGGGDGDAPIVVSGAQASEMFGHLADHGGPGGKLAQKGVNAAMAASVGHQEQMSVEAGHSNDSAELFQQVHGGVGGAGGAGAEAKGAATEGGKGGEKGDGGHANAGNGGGAGGGDDAKGGGKPDGGMVTGAGGASGGGNVVTGGPAVAGEVSATKGDGGHGGEDVPGNQGGSGGGGGDADGPQKPTAANAELVKNLNPDAYADQDTQPRGPSADSAEFVKNLNPDAYADSDGQPRGPSADNAEFVRNLNPDAYGDAPVDSAKGDAKQVTQEVAPTKQPQMPASWRGGEETWNDYLANNQEPPTANGAGKTAANGAGKAAANGAVNGVGKGAAKQGAMGAIKAPAGKAPTGNATAGKAAAMAKNAAAGAVAGGAGAGGASGATSKDAASGGVVSKAKEMLHTAGNVAKAAATGMITGGLPGAIASGVKAGIEGANGPGPGKANQDGAAKDAKQAGTVAASAAQGEIQGIAAKAGADVGGKDKIKDDAKDAAAASKDSSEEAKDSGVLDIAKAALGGAAAGLLAGGPLGAIAGAIGAGAMAAMGAGEGAGKDKAVDAPAKDPKAAVKDAPAKEAKDPKAPAKDPKAAVKDPKAAAKAPAAKGGDEPASADKEPAPSADKSSKEPTAAGPSGAPKPKKAAMPPKVAQTAKAPLQVDTGGGDIQAAVHAPTGRGGPGGAAPKKNPGQMKPGEPTSEAQKKMQAVREEAAWKKDNVKAAALPKAQRVGAAAMQKKTEVTAEIKKQQADIKAHQQAEKKKAQDDLQAEQQKQAQSIEELKVQLETTVVTELGQIEQEIAQQQTETKTKLEADKKRVQDEATTQITNLRGQSLQQQEAQIKQATDQAKTDFRQQADAQHKLLVEQSKAEKINISNTARDEGAKVLAEANTQATNLETKGNTDAAAARSKAQGEAAQARSAAQAKAASARAQQKKDEEGVFGTVKGWFSGDAGAAAISEGERIASDIIAKGNLAAEKLINQAKEAATKLRNEGKDKQFQLTEKAKSEGQKLDQAAEQARMAMQKSIEDNSKKMDENAAKKVADAKAKIEASCKEIDAKAKASVAKIDKELADAGTKMLQEKTKRIEAVNKKAEAMRKKLATAKDGDLAKLNKEVHAAQREIDSQSEKAHAEAEKVSKQAVDMAKKEADMQVKAIAAEAEKALKTIDGLMEAALKGIEADAAAAEQQLAAIGAQGTAMIEKGSKDAQAGIKADSAKAIEGIQATAATETKKLDDELAKQSADMEKMKDGTPDPELEAKKQRDAMAAAEAKKLEEAMDGWGTDEASIMKSLKGKSPDEIKAIKEAYEKKTGRSLDSDLKDELSGDELVEAMGHASGDPVQSAVAELRNSGGGWFSGGDADKMKSVLNNPALTPEQKQKIYDEFESQTGKSLTDFAKDELGNKDATDVTAALGPIKVEVFDPNKPPPLGPDEKPPNRSAMKKAAADLRAAMDGMGTDEEKIMKALQGKTPAEAHMIRAEYEKEYKVDLMKQLEGELSGADLAAAKAGLKADPVKMAAAMLQQASEGLGTDEKKIHDTLAQIKDPAQRRALEEDFQKRTGITLTNMVNDEMTGTDKDIAQAYVDGDPTKAAAIRLDAATNGGFFVSMSDGIADTLGVDRKAMQTGLALGTGVGNAATVLNGGKPTLSFGGDANAVYDVLSTIEDPAEREAVKKAFEERTGQKLDDVLSTSLSGAEKDAALAYSSGDMEAASAARMKAGADTFWGTDEKSIYAQLEGKPDWQRKQIIDAYNAKYGQGPDGQSFDAMLADEMDGLDLEKAQMLVKEGKVPPEFEIEYALDGIGTDEDAVKNVLKGKTAAEVDKIRAAWNKRHPNGPSLDGAIKDDMPDGRDGFEVGMMLEGEPDPKDPNYAQKMLERADRKYQFERGSGFSSGVMDVFSDSGKDLDRDHEELMKLKAVLDKGGQLSAEQKALLDDKLEWQDLNKENYVAAKNTVTDGIATGAALVAGVAVSALTAGAAAPFVVAALGALAGGAATIGVKMAMQGGAYGIEDMGIDVAKTILQAATAGGMKYFGPAMDAALKGLGPTAAAVIQGALSGAIGGMTDAAFDEAASRDLGDWLKNMLSSAGKGALGGAAGGAMGAIPNSGGKGKFAQMMGPINEKTSTLAAMGKGAFNSVLGSIGSTMVDPAMYEGRWEDVAMKWGKTLGSAAIQGMGDGYVERQEAAMVSHAEAARDKVVEAGGGPMEQQKAYHEAIEGFLDTLPTFDNKGQQTGDTGSTVSANDNQHSTTGGDQAGGSKPKSANDNDQPVVHANDNEKPVVHANDNEQPVVKVNESDQPVVHANDNEKPVVHAGDEAVAKNPDGSPVNKTDNDPTAVKTKADADAETPVVHADGTPAVHPDGSPVTKADADYQPPKQLEGKLSKAAEDALKLCPPEKRAALESAMATLHEAAITKTPAEIAADPVAMKAFVEAHTAMREAMFADGALLGKVIPVDAVDQAIRGINYKGEAIDNHTTGGFIGNGANLQGTPDHIIKLLGLDYNDTAYVKSTGDGKFVTAESLSKIEFAVTEKNRAQMMEALKVPVDPAIHEQMQKLAETDPKAAALLKELVPHKIENTDGLNPYLGIGSTNHGGRLGDNKASFLLNQETTAGKTRFEMPDGTQLKTKLPSGTDITIATYVIGADGKGSFVINEKLPTAIRERYERLQAQGASGGAGKFSEHGILADSTPVSQPLANANPNPTTHTDTGDGSTVPMATIKADATADTTPPVIDTTPVAPVETVAPKGDVPADETATVKAPKTDADDGGNHTPPPTTHDTGGGDGPGPKKAKTPEELAADIQAIANKDRADTIAKKQEIFSEIDALAAIATTKEDWEFIRKLEHDAGRPVSERFSPHDDVAKLQLADKNGGELKHPDGTPMSAEEAAAHRQKVAADAEAKTNAHNEAIDALTGEVKGRIKQRDEQTTNDIAQKALQSSATDEAGNKIVTIDQAISLGMGGAGASGAKEGHTQTGNDNVVATRTDRIGIEDTSKPELWGTLGHKPMGQEANAITYGKDGIATKDVAEHPTAQVAKASELALQVAAQRDASEVGTLGSNGSVGELKIERKTLPDGTEVLQVGVPVKMMVDGVEQTVIVTTTKGVDISSGMGEARSLTTDKTESGGRPKQIDADHAAALKASGQLMSGEQALASDASHFEGKRVLGIGGGPTSEWAMEHALKGGASSVEVAGKMPRPDPKSEQGKTLTKLEADIRELAMAGKPVPPEMTEQHHQIVQDHVQAQMAELATQKAIADNPDSTPRQKELAEQAMGKIKADIDPFLGSRVDRNHDTLNNGQIKHVQADIMFMKPAADGSGAIDVYYADGTMRQVDQVVPSIGSDHKAPGGVDHMLKSLAPDVEMIPVIVNGRVVGVESNPPGLTISGAALTGSTGLNMPDTLLTRIPPEMRDAFMSSLVDHANRADVSDGSRGIVPGIENVGSNPAEMQKALAQMSPADRQKALEAFLLKHELTREATFGGEARFSDKDLKIPTGTTGADALEAGKTNAPRTGSDAEHHDAVQQKKADAAYAEIRESSTDVASIAKNTGLPAEMLEQVKQHLFANSHTIPGRDGQDVQMPFVPNTAHSDLWKAAEAGTLTPDQRADLAKLLTHELVESTLEAQGMPVYTKEIWQGPAGSTPDVNDGNNWYRPFAADNAHDLAGIAEHGFKPSMVDKMPAELKESHLETMVRSSLLINGKPSPAALAKMHPDVQRIFEKLAADSL